MDKAWREYLKCCLELSKHKNAERSFEEEKENIVTVLSYCKGVTLQMAEICLNAFLFQKSQELGEKLPKEILCTIKDPHAFCFGRMEKETQRLLEAYLEQE